MVENKWVRMVGCGLLTVLLFLVVGTFPADTAHGQSEEEGEAAGESAKEDDGSIPDESGLSIFDLKRLAQALQVSPETELPQEEGEPAPALEPPTIDAKPTPEEERATYLEAKLRRLEEERKSLEALQKDISEELASLEKLKQEIDQRLAQEDELTQQRVAKLVDIYNRMDLDKLVKVLEKHPEALRINLLYRMKEKRVSEILQQLNPEEAAEISRKLLNKKTK